MPDGKDYLAVVTVDPNDKLDYGVLGQRWGVRRSSTELRSATAKRPTDKTDDLKKPSGSESSTARYARLQAQAKTGGASKMEDDDLKFFNARTEAIAKVEKLNQSKPGWIQTVTKKVMQNTAEQQIQAIAASVANKYISKPIIDQVNNGTKKP